MTADELTDKLCKWMLDDLVVRAQSPVVRFALGAASVGAGRDMVSRKVHSFTALFSDQGGNFDVESVKRSVLAGFDSSGPMPLFGGIVTVDRADAERFFSTI